jgi:hypothetical protein
MIEQENPVELEMSTVKHLSKKLLCLRFEPVDQKRDRDRQTEATGHTETDQNQPEDPGPGFFRQIRGYSKRDKENYTQYEKDNALNPRLQGIYL